jgi:hypothetical protein
MLFFIRKVSLVDVVMVVNYGFNAITKVAGQYQPHGIRDWRIPMTPVYPTSLCLCEQPDTYVLAGMAF